MEQNNEAREFLYIALLLILCAGLLVAVPYIVAVYDGKKSFSEGGR